MNTTRCESSVNKEQIIKLCARAMKYYDARLVDHGERVAFIAWKLYNELEDKSTIDLKNLLILSVFHDVGAYKTDEIDRMVEFESENVREHSIYGYLFLKHFAPLGSLAKVLLFHHSSNELYNRYAFKYKDYSNLIHLADRIDVAMLTRMPRQELFEQLRSPKFCQTQVDAFERALGAGELNELAGGECGLRVMDAMSDFDISEDEAEQYLRMLVFSIDFKSEYTVVHAINTIEISLFLARGFGLSESEQREIYFAALVHDIGKMAIDPGILEFPGRLSYEQMEIMKKHVVYTREIIEETLPEEICRIAARHHEKLDGTGYPEGLTAEQLSLSDRIVGVADIVSALVGKRSYKENFDRVRTLSIIGDMARDGLIDREVVALITERFDELERTMREKSRPIIELYERIHSEYERLLTMGT